MGARTTLVECAGLFAAASELSRQNWLVALTIGDAPRTDLLVQQAFDSHISAAIQVKTRSEGDFHLGNVTNLSPPRANEWVILVSLEPNEMRSPFCIVPRNHVCAVVLELGRKLAEQGKNWSRKMIGEQEFKEYRGCWNLLNEPAENVPLSLLPQWVLDGLRDHPQPELSSLLGLSEAGL